MSWALRHLLPAIALLALVGCQMPQSAKQEARRAWDAERAGLKSQQATAELEGGRADAAVELAREAVTLSPQDSAHTELLARSYLAKGDFKSARTILEQARRLNPNSPDAAFLLGAIAEREQRWDLATDMYRAAIAAAPDELDYHIALAQALAQAGQADAALARLRENEPQFSAAPVFHRTCAELHRQAGRLPEASAAYARALQLGADDVPTREALGLCLYWLGRYAEALDYLEPLIRRDEKASAAVASGYAGCALATGQTRAAADWLATATRIHPNSGELWMLLAQAHTELGDLDAARSAAHRAVELLPKSARALTLEAMIALAAGADAQSETIVRKALQLDGRHVDALLLYGRLCEKRKDRAAAIQSYTAALKAEPGNETAERLLARLR